MANIATQTLHWHGQTATKEQHRQPEMPHSTKQTFMVSPSLYISVSCLQFAGKSYQYEQSCVMRPSGLEELKDNNKETNKKKHDPAVNHKISPLPLWPQVFSLHAHTINLHTVCIILIF